MSTSGTVPARAECAWAQYARDMTYEPVQIATGGATLVGDRWNGAGATIVLLHAGVCDLRCWREVGTRLGAAGTDVVAYDRRGFGDVPPADGPFRHVDDVLAVLDAVSPHAPAWLVGSSMGGGVALDAVLSDEVCVVRVTDSAVVAGKDIHDHQCKCPVEGSVREQGLAQAQGARGAAGGR